MPPPTLNSEEPQIPSQTSPPLAPEANDHAAHVHPQARKASHSLDFNFDVQETGGSSPPGLPPVALRSPLHVKTHNAARVTHLPEDHSQVGWLPPSCVPCRYSEKDSSLLTQGIPVGYGDRVRIPGIIPANAGNTWPTGRTVSTRADHPCLRGEHTV